MVVDQADMATTARMRPLDSSEARARREAPKLAFRRAAAGARLDIIEHERGLPGNRVYYMAIPAALMLSGVS